MFDESGSDETAGQSPATIADWAHLSDFDLVDAIAGDSARIAAAEADRLVKIAALYARPCMSPLPTPSTAGRNGDHAPGWGLTREEVTQAEIKAKLCLRDVEARRLVQTALALTTRLPATLAALAGGRLDLHRATMIHEHATPLADDHRAQALATGLSPEAAEQAARNVAGLLEELVLPKAFEQAPPNLSDSLTRAVNRLDSGFAERAAERKVEGRYVSHRTNRGQSTGELWARLGAADALGVYTVIDGYSRLAKSRGDKRTLDQLRADTLTHLILNGCLPDAHTEDGVWAGAATVIPDDGQSFSADQAEGSTRGASEGPPEGPGEGPSPRPSEGMGADYGTENSGDRPGRPHGGRLAAHVSVTVGLETLLGMNNETAELAGHGPITAHLARELAFNLGSTWRRLVIDPITGYLLDHGRKVYRPPAALADHVRARDVTCRTPNCDRPATKCDLDHLIPWPAGTTSEPNLCTRCRHDHLLKHQGRWSHKLSDDPYHPRGTVIIVSPTGHSYLSHPYTYTTPGTGPQPRPGQSPSASPSTGPTTGSTQGARTGSGARAGADAGSQAGAGAGAGSQARAGAGAGTGAGTGAGAVAGAGAGAGAGTQYPPAFEAVPKSGAAETLGPPPPF